MDTLFPFKIPDGSGAYIVFLKDDSIPKGIQAYFFRNTRASARAKPRVRVKQDPRRLGLRPAVLSPTQKAILLARLTDIAKRYDYQFDRILEEALRQNRRR